MNLNGNNLVGYPVEMFDASTNEKLEYFESIGKARKFAEPNAKKGTFENKVYRREVMTITYKYKQRNIYFKEL